MKEVLRLQSLQGDRKKRGGFGGIFLAFGFADGCAGATRTHPHRDRRRMQCARPPVLARGCESPLAYSSRAMPSESGSCALNVPTVLAAPPAGLPATCMIASDPGPFDDGVFECLCGPLRGRHHRPTSARDAMHGQSPRTAHTRIRLMSDTVRQNLS